MSQIESAVRPLSDVIGVVARLRQNHALEHATMHILSDALPGSALVGRSTLSGFVIYGEAPTGAVLDAAQEGLQRLQAGQRQLAVHPNCGTSLVLSGVMAGLGAFIVLSRRTKSLWERILLLPLACAAATLGTIVARPLGPIVQARVSTDADVQGLHIAGATSSRRAGILVHSIRTEA